MIEIKKPSTQTNSSMVVIRAASGYELSNYEKHKLARIEEDAQKNKIEVITVNDKRLQIDKNKEVNIELGNLAFKDEVSLDELSKDDLFFIKCEVD
jgi:hypothetical protein